MSDQQAPGYRRTPRGGPTIRSDIVDVFIFRAPQKSADDRTNDCDGVDVDSNLDVEFLQLRRVGPPLDSSWQPVMGHIERGETAIECAVRELEEEVSLRPGDNAWQGFWALEQVHPYYVADIDCVVLGPRFAVRVDPAWAPALNEEHSSSRWVSAGDINRLFTWPGQHAACREILSELLRPGSLAADQLRLTTP